LELLDGAVSYLFGMGAKAPGVIYSTHDFSGGASPARLVARAVDSGFGWVAVQDGVPMADPAQVGKWIDPGVPRLHPEIAALVRGAGMLFGVVGRWASGTGGRTNASTQDSVDFWAPDFLIYEGADDYWPGSRWSNDRMNIAAFVAANPGLPMALMTGAVVGTGRSGQPTWDPYGTGTINGAWGDDNSPNIKARIQAFYDNGFDLIASMQPVGYHPDDTSELLTIAGATWGWSADKICPEYYLSPSGLGILWGDVTDMAATGGQWAAVDTWPPNAYDFAWCMADRYVYGDAP
jgi:hypothetical protein